MTVTVVIGGTRSGKSAHAEQLARASGLPVRYVATADAHDPAMAARIEAHVARRPAAWTTVEAGAALARGFECSAAACVLLDGLGAWIASALHVAAVFERPDLLARVREEVLCEVDRAVLAAAQAGSAIIVAEQAGEGLLPPDAVSRAWLDLLGEATQRFAAHADHVELVVAGRVLRMGDARPAEAAGARRRQAPRRDGAPAGIDALRGYDDPDVPGDARPDGAPAGIDALRRHGDRDVRPGDADHAVNVVAGGPPPWLREALLPALEAGVASYPDDRPATRALAERHGRDEDEVVATNGAAEALWLLPAALRPRLAACVHPGFTEAEAALRAHGVPVVRVLRDPQRGFALDPTDVPEAADLVIVGNPASPSGTLDPSDAILAMRRPGRVIAVDEAFMDLVPGEPGSLVRERLHDVVVIRSLTKALAVPGLRAGYAVAAAPLAEQLRAVRPPWSANALALAALETSARHPDKLAAIAERVAAERDDLARRLEAVPGVRTWPSAANFCLVEVADGPALVAALRAQRIAVRPAASFPGLGPHHVRLTARAPERNAALVAAIEDALAPVRA
jgi:histidinol-phosphate/aromatic aminotransferase/cobyric acid decarboxylase-like protein/adenosyl cobinamide kinase/adenosyl cobinamide phosphate guanylyltransferase